MTWHEDPYWEGRCLICACMLSAHKDGKCPRPLNSFAKPVGIRNPTVVESLCGLPEVIHDIVLYIIDQIRKRFSGKSNDPASSSAEDAEADAKLGNA